MTVALLERFAEASRRCDPDLLLPPGTPTRRWDLAPRAHERVPGTAELARAVAGWVTAPGPVLPRWQAARAVAAMRGWPRRRAVVEVAGWLRAAGSGEVDEVACFSARHFPLASALAAATGAPLRELLAHGTHYLGEFAFELLAVVPYAYWLHQQGRLRFTVSTPDTRCLYYFSPRHIERPTARRYVPITEYPVGEVGEDRFDRAAFPAVLDTSRWSPPPYREVFADDRFRWAKPPVVVCNKTSDEDYLGDRRPVNSLDPDLLVALVGRLRERYTVIYDRPGPADIVNDHAAIRDPGDHAAVRAAHPEVITIQELHAAHPDLTFNELQLRVFAGCRAFVSVLGGSSYLASWFGGTNVVYAQRGWEVDCDAYEGWFHRFSGARVVAADTPERLLATVDRELLG